MEACILKTINIISRHKRALFASRLLLGATDPSPGWMKSAETGNLRFCLIESNSKGAFSRHGFFLCPRHQNVSFFRLLSLVKETENMLCSQETRNAGWMSLEKGVCGHGKHFRAKCLKQTRHFGFKVTAGFTKERYSRLLATKHKFAYFNYSCIFKIDKKCCGQPTLRSSSSVQGFLGVSMLPAS